MLVEREVP
jgi:hypothetical protein